MATWSTQPTSFFLPSIQALLGWTPASQPFDAFNIATVPLRPRLAVTGPRVMDGNDFMDGYVTPGDLTPQGAANLDIYNFTYWQYLDSFYYFAHQRVVVPTAWWINAAHLNGVPVMGTLDFETGLAGSGSDLAMMLNAENSADCITQLVALANHYGFDGWFFNIEVESLPNGKSGVPVLVSFLKQLGQQLKQTNPAAMVIWYDSITSDGTLAYQNCLDSDNNVFFEASDGIFTNYWWSADDLQTSNKQIAADNKPQGNYSPTQVYSGVYVWASGTSYAPGNTQPGDDAVTAVGQSVAAGQSVGLFAPGWTFQKATPGAWPSAQHHAAFEALDTSFWTGNTAGYNSGASKGVDCMAAYIPERSAAGNLPFATNFDRGCGTNFTVRGQPVSNTAWGNLSLQGPQPTYRFWALPGSKSSLTLNYAYANGYDGGASLVLTGTNAAASDTASFRLFDLNTRLSGGVTVNLVFKPLANVYPGLQVKLVFSDNSTYVTGTTATSIGNGWYNVSGTFTGGSGKTLTQLVLVAGPAVGSPVPSSYGVIIGQLSVVPTGAVGPASVTGLTAQTIYSDAGDLGALLTWNSPTGAARFFDVWRTDGASPIWLMRVCANTAWVPNLATMGSAVSASFAIQPVDYSLTAQPLSQAAQVTLSQPATSFTDAPTVALLGNPDITSMTIMAGDVLNAIQATYNVPIISNNGSASTSTPTPITLPQHGSTSGISTPVTLAAGETIRSVTISTGNWFGRVCVVQLSMTTSANRKLGPFGTTANVATPISANTVAAPVGQSLVAFSGTLVNVPLVTGQYVDIIQSLTPIFG